LGRLSLLADKSGRFYLRHQRISIFFTQPGGDTAA
jgi:hypothetical protein